MNVPFLDLTGEISAIRPLLDEAWARVRDKGSFILGTEVAAFESEFASHCGVRNCVGVASGLDALRLVLMAHDVGAGDEVVVPAYTAVATWMAVTSLGAYPKGVDVDEQSFNLNPALLDAAIGPKTKAVVAVHLFGRPADIEVIKAVATARGVPVIEDAAQAHGARIGERRVGSLARAAAFSFYPTKNLGALGDGGAVTTDDDDLADRVRMLRSYGWRDRSTSEIFGLNSRLDELQAAFLRVRLSRLDEDNGRRQELARRYGTALQGIPDLLLPCSSDDSGSVWHVYAVKVPERDVVGNRLAAAGIGSLVHYDPLPHLTPAFRAAGWKAGDYPVSERLSRAELSLPMYPHLAIDTPDRVAAALGG